MAEVRYFVYTGEGTFRKVSADRKMYVFVDRNPIAVEVRSDQYKFAGDPLFIETDKAGKELPFSAGALPSNNPKGPITYTTIKREGAVKPAPAPSVEGVKEEAKEDKKAAKKAAKKEDKKEDK